MSVTLAENTTVGVNFSFAAGRVTASVSSLKIDVASFKYDIGGVRGAYDGAVSQSVTDDDTSYVYLSNIGALVINTTGFPTDVSNIPLARVVAANGEVVAIHEERVLLASSTATVGTCRIGYPVDGDIRGGQTAASSNNDYAAIRYNGTPDTDTGRNRWNRRPPQNYSSGDLKLRILYSWATAPSNNDTIILEWSWSFRDLSDALGTWDGNDQQSFDVDTESADVLYYKELTMPDEDFDIDADLMMMKFERRTDLSGDDCDENMYVHQIELVYTGYRVAGQPGQ